MQAALALARRGRGRVAPNPAVGCVLVRDGRVLGRGWTQPGGRPHAETEALDRAGPAARGATAYVTLEPCAHHGRTPPCAEALIAAGITRCVVALEDPDPRVAGGGLDKLRAAEIAVDLGLLAESAAEVNAGYLMRLAAGRPLVTLKLATTLDGRIATKSGESRWITGPAARARTHLLRAASDAVLVGGGTALADNPRLDVRLAGLEDRAPLRVVLDGRLRLPLTHDLVLRAGGQPTCLVTRPGNDRARLEAYRGAGLEVLETPDDAEGNLSLEAALQALGGRGVNDLLVEGGGQVAAGLLSQGLVDRLVWFRAPRVIGGDGLPGAGGFGLDRLDAAPRFERVSVAPVGEDLMETYRRVP
ncbi:MAG: bifunctional diaminohydroxyphosphoribosylaminopyrimidine deaminase/5-amino-6-(5-phosphoribosylamino)uracil reductase RibD [Rhodospirillales bacterium]|nr:bifunctional diaminohydroxyphosphoribosylaminopyrimidine deaminase/5-amino-6-(5-phosphoribosylamino)uracil reductase RibD [Rhodospirillales bacterium]MDH3791269.1 bifunctional diaminohydroxyphosphoribosylaminopyrimidine deaminase/5-amino-6-(5-phosphoribosylamino)uracil reductase RibD [Rhodospirillales bacterium]MDH3909855.1 bifunctional diaminohydroxyphosphoribosylaminopyrimidine deaminase/5-amino-6-(5-phosphoribosylamino)uracil reductase RibD [Rhodospirillales bacterium]MDH3917131.1 bifuncti